MTQRQWLIRKLNEVDKKLEKDSLFKETHEDFWLSDKRFNELLEERKIISEILGLVEIYSND